jgi:heme exporter protein A
MPATFQAHGGGPLEARSLGAVRGARRLFASLDFRLEAGNVLIVRGANGAGKTTLLRTLAGLSAPESGDVAWAGVPCKPHSPLPRGVCVYLGHANALKDELSAADNLRHALWLDGVAASAEDCVGALEAAGLKQSHRLPVRQLSQGQKRRIGLARLGLSRKPVWLLDEPGNALDEPGLTLLQGLVAAHTGRGGMAVIATHQALRLDVPGRELLIGGAA